MPHDESSPQTHRAHLPGADGVVVGVSATASGASALDWALQHAALRGLPLLAVRAWDIPAYGSYYSVGSALRSTEPEFQLAEAQVAEDALSTAVDRLPNTKPVDSHAVALMGRAPEVLLSAAEDAALLVVGTRGAGALTRLVQLGSVSSSVLHHASVPVAIVPQQSRTPDSAGPVVVGWDGSVPAAAALRWAVSQARAAGAPLVPVAVHPERARLNADEVDAERAHMAEAVQRAAGGDLAVEPHVRFGHAAEELMAVAETAALLVLGSRGRGGFSRLLVGSTSTQCAGHAPCPMVVVRSS